VDALPGHRVVSGPWPLRRREGSAGDLHAAPPDPDRRQVVVSVVNGPAIVLGSSQPDPVDHDRAGAAGVEVVRRRTGGGAVWLERDDPLWVDVCLPHDDPLADDDVGRAAMWVGETWAGALEDLGLEDVAVCCSTTRPSGDLSRLLCFGGRGPGEVTVGGSKVVGIAQRRTRSGALFSCAVASTLRVRDLVDLLDPTVVDHEAAMAALRGATGARASHESLTAALLSRMP